MKNTSVMSGELFSVTTPIFCTASGRRGSACCTRFCTCTCAESRLVPSSNVTVIEYVPSVWAEAPGNWPLTTMVGGTTSGYSLIGRIGSATRPTMKMTTARTVAKIGRSMKNEEIFMGVSSNLASRGRVTYSRRGLHRYDLGRHGGAGAHALQASDDNLVAGRQSIADNAHAVDHPSELYHSRLDLVVLAQDEYEAIALIGANCHVVHQ